MGRGQWVRYPLRVVVDTAAYADADTKVYGKVAALSRRRACEASVAKLAEYAGLSMSATEKALTRLSRPAPTDGVRELTRKQRSHKGSGNGRTNERTTRALEDGERYIDAPVRAADTLRGTLHRLYLLLRYTTVVEHRDLTCAEIGEALRHHGGKHAGEPLHERTASLLLDELEAAGWITQDKRAGYRGRHQITVHDDPVHLVDQPDPAPTPPTTPAPTTPGAEYGAAPDLECGAPAYKEDQELNDSGNNPPTAVLGIRRRRPTGGGAREMAVDTFGRRAGLDLTPAAWRVVWSVLDPVRHELDPLTGWEWERLVHDVLRHLGDGQTPERLRDRVQRRYTVMRTDDPDEAPAIGSFARWLIGAALVRRGCENGDCETGTLWSTGISCPACALRREMAETRARLDAEPARPVRQITARPAQVPREQRAVPAPARPPLPPHRPPTGHVGPPPGTGGWRALVARERPQAAAHAYQHRWTGEHARHLPDATGT
ncbi:hypothetical protein SsS58_02271 [Streptomyces scabiei]|uniref:Uncharacterized protein n=1 Tax=Streptomyces scabiei TaxID=1930 RepID=A0A100JM19_STRSC|nr:hypothetical protein SsS58_02271 [Streptomyces scabiei]